MSKTFGEQLQREIQVTSLWVSNLASFHTKIGSLALLVLGIGYWVTWIFLLYFLYGGYVVDTYLDTNRLDGT